MARKLRVGWFSFSCCEDSTIVFTELLNEHYRAWLKVLDFRAARVLQKRSDLRGLDVAFIEGAIASERDEQEAQRIRRHAKKVVAIGSCAVTGMPSAQRNFFDEEKRARIRPLVEKFCLARTVRRLDEVIAVDAKVPGCPMSEKMFLHTLNQCLKEFGVDAQL